MMVLAVVHMLGAVFFVTGLTIVVYEGIDDEDDGRSPAVRQRIRRWAPACIIVVALLWPVLLVCTCLASLFVPDQKRPRKRPR